MTDEEHQNKWPRAMAMINFAAARKPLDAGSYYDLSEAQRVVHDLGYYSEHLHEIAERIKSQADKMRANPQLKSELT